MGGPVEQRTDPDDGQAYTWDEIHAFYAGTFKKREIADYWQYTMWPIKGKGKGKKGGDRERPKEKKRKGRADIDESKNEVQETLASGGAQALCKRRSTLTFRHEFTARNPGRIADYYDIEGKPLGEGAFGTVAKGTDKATTAVRAVKIIDSSKIKDTAQFELEVGIQQELNHPNIVRLYEVFKDAKRVYLVMELCTGGELFDLIQEAEWFGEEQAATYIRQILSAISYMHSSHYVHRDIKPENFLLQNRDEDASMKIIDFGLSKAYTPGCGQRMKSLCGTPYYMAPQVLEGAYDEKCDVWSIGCIMYVLLSGDPPFQDQYENMIMKKVKVGKFEFPDDSWEEISAEAKDLICRMLTRDDKGRPSAADVLKHAWLEKNAERPKGKLKADFGGKLRSFRNASKFKRVALTVMAQRLADEDVEELRLTFQTLDTDGDGTLTYEKVKAGFEKHSLEVPEELQNLMRSLDSDGSGQVDYTEFLAATIDRAIYARKEIVWSAFRMFDKDGDGKITKDELASLLKVDADDTMVAEMIESADLDGDGCVDYEEFMQMMESESPARRKTLVSNLSVSLVSLSEAGDLSLHTIGDTSPIAALSAAEAAID